MRNNRRALITVGSNVALINGGNALISSAEALAYRAMMSYSGRAATYFGVNLAYCLTARKGSPELPGPVGTAVECCVVLYQKQ